MKPVTLPELSLLLLVGPSACGKTEFARKHFLATEIISSDICRALVCDDESDQSVTKDAFDLVHYIAEKRLKAGKFTVIDATNVQPEARKSLLVLARKYHMFPSALVFDLPLSICLQRNKERAHKSVPERAIRVQHRQMRSNLKNLRKREGFTRSHIFCTQQDIDAITLQRHPTWSDKRQEKGPFDIIGDVHGCFAELRALLEKLDYAVRFDGQSWEAVHAQGRKPIFVGDLVDRGPESPAVLCFVRDLVSKQQALCVNGNHDDKLKRYLEGRKVTPSHGLAETLIQLEKETEECRSGLLVFLRSLISHYVLDDGKLAVTHAGLKEEFIGRGSPAIRQFCMYGETTGETDSFGLPVRYDWARSYRGKTLIAYGHTPVEDAVFYNNTINLDTGCVYGGRLSAMRYPEKTILSVGAQRAYAEARRPMRDAAPHARKDLYISDVQGKLNIETELCANIIVPEDYTSAALETVSRSNIEPGWFIYAPPTMAPCDTSKHAAYLEYPDEALAYFRKKGVKHVIAQEKHMGSRVILVLAKNATAAEKFFARDGEYASCYTRSGWRFFDDKEMESAFLDRLRKAVDRADVWKKLETDWLCLDAEMLPWSAKSQELLKGTYAGTAEAANRGLNAAQDILLQAGQRADADAQLQQELGELRNSIEESQHRISDFARSFRSYCWPTGSLDSYKLAPFHLLGYAGCNGMNKDHGFHMRWCSELCEADPSLFLPTSYREITDIHNTEQCEAVCSWWEDITARGSEGIVVKPWNFTHRSGGSIVLPGLKCRGRSYLRLVYGPDYTLERNMVKLKKRNTGDKKALAMREYALGHKAMDLFIEGAPLHARHACVFAVLALESKPVDPRL